MEAGMPLARNLLDTLTLWVFSLTFETAVALLGLLRPARKASK